MLIKNIFFRGGDSILPGLRSTQTRIIHWRTKVPYRLCYSMAFEKGLPHFAKGEVVKGFGRGSKDLGIPTANFPVEVVNHLPKEIETGVYCGFASVDKGAVYKMVMSVGWNPFYKNKTKSMETHILHKFDDDFYGKELRVAILKYFRPQTDFGSLDELIEAINTDIKQANEILDSPNLAKYKDDKFFTD